MQLEKKQSIGRKISLVVLSAVIVSVMSATGFFLWRQTSDALDARHRQLTAVANVFASVVSSHTKNNDKVQTLVALRAIKKIPNIPYAVVSRNDGSVLAVLGQAIVLTSQINGVENSNSKFVRSKGKSVFSLLNSTTLPITVPVIHGGEKVGDLFLLTNVADLRKSLFDGFLVALLAVISACFLGMLIAARMKRKITSPITSLTRAMSDVQQTHDFKTRVERQSDDETGQLVDSFNDMLSQISQRDESLADHRANLEQTVDERTKELVVAKNVAEEANMAKSDFLATMSHEIRTPMNGVMVMAELLAAGELLPRQQRYAEVIVRSGQSLLTIINDILDLSKIEAGKLQLEQVPISPAAIIDDVISLFWQQAASKNIDLASFVDSRVPVKIIGDPVRLNQVLSNLVNNALKFTQTGYVAISVKSIYDDANGACRLEFSVIDTGIGIAVDKVSSVFQEFTQADQTTTRKFGGTGLGLSICKKLVAAMNGRVDVESVLHKGSRFYFEIPVEITQSAPAINNCVNSKISAAGIIVDGTASRQSIASYLRAHGVNVEMIEPDDAAAFDFSQLDVVFSCSKVIAKMADIFSKLAHTTIIAVTQLGETAGEDLVCRGIAHDLIVRPVDRMEMIAMIERLALGKPRGIEAVKNAVRTREALPQFSTARVLIADDNAVNREVIIEVLRQLGVAADVANDGQEAIAKWTNGKFDLIFMDCSMPVMDGYTATRKIREQEQIQGIEKTPIIALTAHISGDNAEKWQSAGMDDYITKPFTIRTIAERMGLLLPASSVPPTMPGQEPEGQLRDVTTVLTATSSNTLEHENIPVLDETVISDLRESGGGSNGLLERVFKLFEDNAPASLTEIEQFSSVEDGEALADAVHSLKSMCANIGAIKAAEACDVLELAARKGTEIDFGSAVGDISSALHEVLGQIKKYQVA